MGGGEDTDFAEVDCGPLPCVGGDGGGGVLSDGKCQLIISNGQILPGIERRSIPNGSYMFYGHVAHKFVVVWDNLYSCLDVWMMEVGDAGGGDAGAGDAGGSDAGGDDAGGSDAWGRASMSKQGANASGVGGKLSRHQRRVNVFF